jgi:hypothetical protein
MPRGGRRPGAGRPKGSRSLEPFSEFATELPPDDPVALRAIVLRALWTAARRGSVAAILQLARMTRAANGQKTHARATKA